MVDRVDKEKAALLIQTAFRARKGLYTDINSLNDPINKEQVKQRQRNLIGFEEWYSGNLQKDGKIKLYRYIDSEEDFNASDFIEKIIKKGHNITARKFNSESTNTSIINTSSNKHIGILKTVYNPKVSKNHPKSYQNCPSYSSFTNGTVGGWEEDPNTYWMTLPPHTNSCRLWKDCQFCIEIELSPDEAFRSFDKYEHEWFVPGVIPNYYITKIYQDKQPIYSREGFDSYNFLRKIKNDPKIFHECMVTESSELLNSYIKDMTRHGESVSEITGISQEELREKYASHKELLVNLEQTCSPNLFFTKQAETTNDLEPQFNNSRV
ncbi:hypothetical protein DA717_14550 [Piscirickettsiaceae bacterium NZ-RLO2]|uniref:hypothetical protein n=1 Tax=Piscirickettsia salmonis TaxID=1238 RepID=UPI000F07F1A8|nr:hypothetical protein DA717_14550 [Piscirickettsiaceae bacterium NZ-RLO2]